MENKSKKVNKYLTDLKELSTEQKNSQHEVKNNFKPKVEEVVSKVSNKSDLKKDANLEMKMDQVVAKDLEEDKYINEDTLDKWYSPKDIILGAINLFSILFLVFVLIKMPQKADELKALRIENLRDSKLSVSTFANLDEFKSKSSQLEKLFLDDSGVVNFAVDIEKLKVSHPEIIKVTFTSQKPIKDKLGLSGIPVIVTIQGTWENVGNAMNSIETLPYLFRPAVIKIEPFKDDTNVKIVSYGGILYVGEKFTKN